VTLGLAATVALEVDAVLVVVVIGLKW
jgi:hypothetical protein